MESVLLAYGATSRTINALSVKGYDEFDDVEFHNAFQNTSDDGTLHENADSHRRVITIDFGVLSDATDRSFLMAFAFSMNNKTIKIGALSAQSVVLADPKVFSNEWIDGVKYSKRYTLKLKTKTSATSTTIS